MQVQMKVKRSASVGSGRQRSAIKSAKVGRGRKKDAYIGKIIPNRVDSTQSIHIMGVVVRSLTV